MNFKLKLGLLSVVFLITAFAFAENGEQVQPAATVAVGQPAAAAAIPETPAVAQKSANVPAKPPLGITYGIQGRLRSDDSNNLTDFSNQVNDETRNLKLMTEIFANVNLGEHVDGFIRVGYEPQKKFYATCTSLTAPCDRQDRDRVVTVTFALRATLLLRSINIDEQGTRQTEDVEINTEKRPEQA